MTWTCTDPSGNTDTCDQQVCVLSGFEATVELRGDSSNFGGAILPFVRPITFELFDCVTGDSLEVCADMVFSTDGLAEDVFVEVPVADIEALPNTGCGVRFTCVTARDTLHSLRRTIDGLPAHGMVDVEFVTSAGKDLWLGNLNDDCFVDRDCKDGFVCPRRRCEEACVNSECPGGFACDSFDNECNTRCIVDSDCRRGFECNWESDRCVER